MHGVAGLHENAARESKREEGGGEMPSSMEELERAAVQLSEANRLAEYNDVAHGRLALLLLDNAAEMSMVRSARTPLMMADWYGNLAYQLEDVDPGDDEGQRLKTDISSKVVSRSRRKQIDRNFGELVDFVFEQKDHPLGLAYAECLKILHRYRNAAYHQDIVREDVLGPAVQISFFLCCHLLKGERGIMDQLDDAPPAVAEILGDFPQSSGARGGFTTSSGLARDLADYFLRARGLDHTGIADALSDHLEGRLKSLDRNLSTIASNGPLPLRRWAVLQLVQQVPTERGDFDKDPPEDFWTRPVPVTEEVLARWGSEAVELRQAQNAVSALRQFASIEQPLAQLEQPVERFIDDIDRQEQLAIDLARGK